LSVLSLTKDLFVRSMMMTILIMATSRHPSGLPLTTFELRCWWSRETTTGLHFSHSSHFCCSHLSTDSCSNHVCSDQEWQWTGGHREPVPGPGGHTPSTSATLSQSYPWLACYASGGYTCDK